MAAGEHEHLAEALRSSREIGMAMRVLMGRAGVTQDEAFGLLSESSKQLNRKLRDIAAEVVETGELPNDPGGATAGDVVSKRSGSA